MPIHRMTVDEVRRLSESDDNAQAEQPEPQAEVVIPPRAPVPRSEPRPGRRSHAHEPHNAASAEAQASRRAAYRNVNEADFENEPVPQHAAETANYVHRALHRVNADSGVMRAYLRTVLNDLSETVLRHAVQIAQTKRDNARFAGPRARWDETHAFLHSYRYDRFPDAVAPTTEG